MDNILADLPEASASIDAKNNSQVKGNNNIQAVPSPSGNDFDDIDDYIKQVFASASFVENSTNSTQADATTEDRAAVMYNQAGPVQLLEAQASGNNDLKLQFKVIIGNGSPTLNGFNVYMNATPSNNQEWTVKCFLSMYWPKNLSTHFTHLFQYDSHNKVLFVQPDSRLEFSFSANIPEHLRNDFKIRAYVEYMAKVDMVECCAFHDTGRRHVLRSFSDELYPVEYENAGRQEQHSLLWPVIMASGSNFIEMVVKFTCSKKCKGMYSPKKTTFALTFNLESP
jgi:P53 DNA-binding domain